MAALDFVLALLFCVAAAGPGKVLSQSYPARPIKIVNPYAPGGGVDFEVRPLAQKMTASLGQPVIVENRPGADGAIGTEYSAHAAPDGYTLSWGNVSTHILNALYHHKINYDPISDFRPISQTTVGVYVLLANPAANINSMPELLARARSEPGKLNYASSGTGSIQHVSGELLKRLAGIDILHVPYKGAGPALNDLAGGVVNLGIMTASTALPQIRGGKLKALAVFGSGTERFSLLPGVPTVGETVPGYASPTSWTGYFGPALLPEAVLRRLNKEIVSALKSPDIAKLYESAGLIVAPSTPEQFASTLASDTAKWKKLVTDLRLPTE